MLAWFQGLVPGTPGSEQNFFVWQLGLMGAYLLICPVAQWVRGAKGQNTADAVINQVAQAATFAGSVLVLYGIVDEAVFSQISVKAYLLFAGFIGVVYTLRNLGR